MNSAAFRFQVITAFPELIEEVFRHGVVGSAVKAGRIELQVVNPRSFTTDPHRTIDDRPYGGGDGMVLMAEPLEKALMSLENRGQVIYLSPQGRAWTDQLARLFSKGEFHPCLRPENAAERKSPPQDHVVVMTLICGRYAGVDERFLARYVADEISIGDYVLSGGELGAAVLMDSISRHVPGTLGNSDSAQVESFAKGLLEGPCYTRPAVFHEAFVPEILSTGHHEKISQWQAVVSLLRTYARRPDLLLKLKWNAKQVVKLQKQLSLLTDEDLSALDLGTRPQAEEVLTSLAGSFAGSFASPLRTRAPSLAVGLVHWPIVDKAGHVVCTNVTNLDIHDIARTARVYGIDRYFIINRQQTQLAFVQRILDHWKIGEGSHYNEMRQTALGPVETAETILHATRKWESRLAQIQVQNGTTARGDQILRIGTSARAQAPEKTISFVELRQFLRERKGALSERGFAGRPVLLLFGTGFGLAPEVEPEIDLWLEPIKGEDRHDYRHLSVRSAVSICLDRLLGSW